MELITTNYNKNNKLRYNKEDYIETSSGNKVNRKSFLCGSQNIRLAGKVKSFYSTKKIFF